MKLPPFRKIIHRSYSDFAGKELFVMDSGSRRTLGIGHFNYSLWSSDPSDDFPDRYWGEITLKLRQKLSFNSVHQVLILGLAGGTLAYLIDKYFHPQKIIGIEIDPEVIAIGRKFFYLDALKNLEIGEKDALEFIDTELQQGKKDHYDLIILDVFNVDDTPENADSQDFYKKIRELVKKDGLIVLNKNFSGDDWEKNMLKFKKQKLTQIFSEIEVARLKRPLKFNNLLFYLKK